jgi:hypothetical protein
MLGVFVESIDGRPAAVLVFSNLGHLRALKELGDHG